MRENLDQERARLSQADFIARIQQAPPLSDLIPVYLSHRDDLTDLCIYSALIPSAKIHEDLNDPSWGLSIGEGIPGAVEYYERKQKKVDYLRYGNSHGVEPLVISRQFHGMRDDYWEISEEFRLFHRLFHDPMANHYIKIDDAGNEHVVAKVEPDRITIRLLEIKQFLAIKEMHLAIMFDRREASARPLTDFEHKEGGEDHKKEFMVYSLAYGQHDFSKGKKAFSRLCGKVLIPPLPREQSGFWGFAAEKVDEQVEFIIGLDATGKSILNTSDPGYLNNNFGSNPDRPHYLTPVHFRKEVLEKYYQQPRKYSVEDNYLRCGGLWGVQIDNHHADRVIVWLGDLGRDLPYEERLHWKGHNVPPSGKVSEVFYKRQILAQFADSSRPEHQFAQKYKRIQELFAESLGWPLLLPLKPQDLHHLKCIRIPASDEQKDFDELILALTKILVDSLNECELNTFIPDDQKKLIKGSISRLEYVLRVVKADDIHGHIKFLRNLQDLRSSGSAHRKGSDYQKIANEFGIGKKPLREVFHDILVQSNSYLDFVEEVVVKGILRKGELKT